jgi:signal transduction histidine kinase
MGIRKRLVMLSVGIAVPLAIVGLVMLWALWQGSRREINHAIEEQSQLAAVAFEKWLDGQRQPLLTLAALADDNQSTSFPSDQRLSYLVRTRPHWIDLQVINPPGLSLPSSADAQPISADVLSSLRSEIARRNAPAVVTDWTRGEGYPLLVLGVATSRGALIVARIDGAAIAELFRSIDLPAGAVIAVFDSQHRVLYRSATDTNYIGTDRSKSPLFSALGDKSSAIIEATSDYDRVRRVYGVRVLPSCGCTLSVGIPRANFYSPARREVAGYLAFSVMALLCAVVAAILIARGIARPILGLREAATEFGSGTLSARARVEGGGELEELGAAFDDMAERIERRTTRLAELDRLKSEFVGGVSHELRTPLTTIKTLTRVLLRGGETAAERHEYLETIGAECDREIDLVLNLLDLTRIEAGALNVSCTRVNVGDVLKNCAAIERHAADARGQELEVQLPSQVLFALADAGALRRVLCCLVENAIKYTPDGGRITLSAAMSDSCVVVKVSDTGHGINKDDAPHIFDKFYRARPSANGQDASDAADGYQEAPGVGLGLYLARNLVEQFSGEITLEESSAHGTTFKVFLPTFVESATENINVKTAAVG